jgi:hypothetical protein
MVGPALIGNMLQADQATLAAGAALLACLLLTIVAVRESRPRTASHHQQHQHAQQQQQQVQQQSTPAQAAATTGRTPAGGSPPPAAGSGGAAVLLPSPAAAAAAVAARRRAPWDVLVSMGRSWRLINSSSLFRRLALCMAVIGVVSEGIQDMLLQYLQVTLGYTTGDTTLLITILGAANFCVQVRPVRWCRGSLGADCCASLPLRCSHSQAQA